MTIFKNADGLYVRYGKSQSLPAREGSPSTNGVEKELIIDIEGTKLPAVGVSTFVNGTPTAGLPAGVLLRSATLIPTKAFTSDGNATLTIGLSKADGTVIDADGIDATIAKTAIDTIGETVACDGALVNTVLADVSYVTVLVGTAAFTAGRAKLVLKYITPDA